MLVSKILLNCHHLDRDIPISDVVPVGNAWNSGVVNVWTYGVRNACTLLIFSGATIWIYVQIDVALF